MAIELITNPLKIKPGMIIKFKGIHQTYTCKDNDMQGNPGEPIDRRGISVWHERSPWEPKGIYDNWDYVNANDIEFAYTEEE